MAAQIAETFGVDWPHLTAQVVSFAIVCALLYWLAYKPVLAMLETMAAMPRIGWLVQIPFYFLELLVGVVQALVFTLLTAVFTLLMCQHQSREETHG